MQYILKITGKTKLDNIGNRIDMQTHTGNGRQ